VGVRGGGHKIRATKRTTNEYTAHFLSLRNP